MSAKEVQAKYICLDIEGYTKRSVDAQLKIRSVLDDVVRECISKEFVPVNEENLMYLPTGDGMCIALLDTPSHVHIHLRVALSILSSLRKRNSQTEYKELEFDVRIGIHADTDYIVKDINGDDNLAGAGINTAFRVMSLADGGQILVSHDVFSDLVRVFRHQFRRFDLRVRHRVPMAVYQFLGEGDGLNKDIPKAVEEQERDDRAYKSIIRPAVDLGLKKVYEFRNDEVGRELIEDINDARRKVWLLGAALSDNFNITDPNIINLLNRKIEERVDVSILLLDGFRSPAIFRALLESNREMSRSIIEADRRLPNPNDPYLAHRVFKNFEDAYNELAKYPNFETAVRFYGHTPSCWLAIVDDKAYYQPYTFGDISDDPAIGFQMPITKWQGRKTTFRILEDHYNKLWVTSDTDLFQTGTRLKAKAETIWKTFNKRGEDGSKWFEHIHGILHSTNNPGVDKRTYSRQPCISLKLDAVITWEGGEETKAKVLDYSRKGVLLELAELTPESPLFSSLPEHYCPSGTEIIALLDIEPEGGWGNFEAKREKSLGLPPIDAVMRAVSAVIEADNEFRYIRKEMPKPKGRKLRVALQARKVKQH
ncbi:MAG TPA: adenylate/guanylate cyclase domain-containing protein [Pyrinomonadaceae bacterium]|jgi:class 3 adenylate cyclase|nr:adenylate/guanylate cyclase domain-containing protein [Pyrinomonadaceae bacterium]